MRRKQFQWTKDRIKTVMQLWDSKTKEELADELGCEKQHIDYIAWNIRKAGYELSKKTQKATLRKLIGEVIDELK